LLIIRLWRTLPIVLGLTLGSALHAPPLPAQSAADLARARTLYNQGLSLEAAGDWSGALAKFEEVGKVKLTPQVRFHIARCKEHLGRLNEALGDYRLAEYEAQQANAKELSEITAARDGLEARIPKLVIRRGKGARAARLELDGVELGEAQVGKEVAVDPGPHTIVAKLKKGEFEETVTLAEGETKEVEMTPPPELVRKKRAIEDEDPEEEPEPAPRPVQAESEGSGALPWVLGGVGLVGFAAAGYFAGQRSAAEDDLNKVCRNGVCPKSAQSKQDDGERYAMFTNVALGVGVAGVGIAAILLLSGGSSAEKPAASKLSLSIATGPTKGVGVAGSF
jgi:tetratricopeptide (TPR) repeat protein